MAVLLKTTSVRVSFIQIMQFRVQNKGKSVWKSRYVGDVSNTVNDKIDCEKQTVGVSFGDESHEFNFSNITVPPTDPLEQYLLEHENDLHMHERNEVDKIFFEQHPLLNTICLLKL